MSKGCLAANRNPSMVDANQGRWPGPDTVETFETYRAYLFSIAYRMLGSVMDAEDMVQEAYLHYQGASPHGPIVSLKAYLATRPNIIGRCSPVFCMLSVPGARRRLWQC